MSCKTSKVNTTLTDVQEKTAFYDFSFKYDTVNKKSVITLQGVKEVDVRAKRDNNEEAKNKPYYIEIEIKDKNNNLITVFAEHPLFRKFDVYEESGKIEAKLVYLPEGSLTIRVPYFVPYKTIKLTEHTDKTFITIIKNEK